MRTGDRVEHIVRLGLDRDAGEPSPPPLVARNDHAAVAAALERAHGDEPRKRHALRLAAHREPARWPHERTLVAVDLPTEIGTLRREAPIEATTDARVFRGDDRVADHPAEPQPQPRGMADDQLDEGADRRVGVTG